jgi:hypothetical protein
MPTTARVKPKCPACTSTTFMCIRKPIPVVTYGPPGAPRKDDVTTGPILQPFIVCAECGTIIGILPEDPLVRR